MFYTLFHSPWQCDFDSLILLLQEGDDLLLLQDGVTAALKNSQMYLKLNTTLANLWILEEDVIARGLVTQISSQVLLLNYAGFVELTIKNQQQVAW
ncbi:sulfurtransferase complex subunit TusB [Pantoea sp. Mhis]|uniref:sulfurtransferase complex subunit TusB n=1 Tax=Pantoea sp. Mhis TaxID=2576759 RepID=UPI00135A2685|nr:sulfurtransferase complex subunit TusB [Pantoea sp. Mhis]MXP56540.1 sulfurtransferase complex subunit TusB [Pantoea sp. Mhis]